MSNKGNDTPSALRIRENQRRSRNRRKELIEELQGRINEYERQGVAATQEMQRAARKVAQENVKLRSLLARHGILQDEVDAFLRSFGDVTEAPRDDSMNASSLPHQHHGAEVMNMSGLHISRAPTSNTFQHSGSVSTTYIVPPSQTSRMISTCTTQHPEQADPVLSSQVEMPPPSPYQSQDNAQHPQNNSSFDAPECPTTSECFCPPTTIPKMYSTPNSFEISCETAATIIVEMRGDGDVDSIRASLGCPSREECAVRTSTVLQIMDEG